MYLIITSELSRQTAGSPRLERITTSLCGAGEIYLVDTRGFWKINVTRFSDIQEFVQYRKNIFGDSNKYSNGSRVGRVSYLLRRIKHFFMLDTIKPSVLSYYLFIRNKKITRVFASSPSFYNILLGVVSKKTHKDSIFWADMRDEWSTHEYIYFHTRIRKYVERKALSSADIVTSVSMAICRKLCQKHSLSNVELLYNFDDSAYKATSLVDAQLSLFDSDFTNFLYIGTMPTGYYDEALFIEFIEYFKNKYINSKPIRFVFVGFSGDLKETLEHKFFDNVKFHPRVSHITALSMMRITDVSIFFAYDEDDNGGIVSTKIFEQIRACKPILPFNLRPESDVDMLIKKYCGSSLYINKFEDFLKIEDDFYHALPKNSVEQPFSDIKYKQDLLIKRFVCEN